MAKTYGALFSQKAQGTIADLLTYQGQKGFRHVHKKIARKDEQTTQQTRKREIFQYAVAGWQGLTEDEKDEYRALSKYYNNNPGYNIYITLYLNIAKYWAKFSWAKFGHNAKFGGP